MVFNQSEADFSKELEKFYSTVSTLQAEYQQQKVSALFSEPLVATGLFLYSKPDKIRWEQKAPTPNYFIINGDAFIQFDGKKMKRDNSGNGQSSILKKFILGTVDGSLLNDKSFLKKLKSEGEFVLIEMVPYDKQLKKRMQRISLLFNKKTKLLQELKIVESETEYTKITFAKQVLNKPIANQKFN